MVCYLLLFGTKYVYKKNLDSENASNSSQINLLFGLQLKSLVLLFSELQEEVYEKVGENEEKRRRRNMVFNADIYEGFRHSVAFSLPCLKLILIYTKG